MNGMVAIISVPGTTVRVTGQLMQGLQKLGGRLLPG
jgi:hypothetical protein